MLLNKKKLEFINNEIYKKKKSITIDKTSIVDPGCQIGENTIIRNFNHIVGSYKNHSAAIIGRCVKIGQFNMVGAGTKIGDNCLIQDHVNICPGVIIKDHVFVGSGVVFVNVKKPKVGIANEVLKTLVKESAVIGAGSTILCGIEIGKDSLVAAGSTVLETVKDFSMVAGNPAKHKKWIDKSGEELVFETGKICYSKKDEMWYQIIKNRTEVIEVEREVRYGI